MSKNTNEPMGGNLPENPTGAPSVNRERDCWSIQRLVTEVNDIFGPVPHETSMPNQFNARLAVTFDLTAVPEDQRDEARDLFRVLRVDTRVGDTLVEDDTAYVEMRNVAAFYDKRDSFDLASAFDIFVEPDEISADAAEWDGVSSW